MSFMIPSELEVQAGDYKEFTELFAQSMDRTGYDCVLQQKGLNDFDPESIGQYCRILIRRIVNSSTAGLTNDVYKEMFGLFSQSEEKAFFDELFDILVGGIVIKEIRDYGTCEIDGKFALYYGVVRESVNGEGDVLLYSYMIPCGETVFTIEAAYRISEEERFSSAIKQFFDSLTFNVEETAYLSEIKIPGSSCIFLWPETNPEWMITADNSIATTRMTISDQFIGRGYLVSVGVVSFNQSPRLYKATYPATLLSKSYNGFTQLDFPGKRLFENKTVNGVGSLKYSYTDPTTEIDVNGVGKYFFVDDYTLVSLEFEYLDESVDEIKEIIKSFGIIY